jgi:hypothetical protein
VPVRAALLVALAVAAGSAARATETSVAGQWAGPYAWPIVAVHATLMPNGKILLWDDHTDNAGVQVWDPVGDSLTATPYVARSLFCSGHTVLPDGRVLAVGGQVSSNVGVAESNLFDAGSGTWEIGADMAFARYYPTATALPDGRVLATSGAINCATCSESGGSHDGLALLPEVYDPHMDAWTTLTGASLSLPMYPHLFLVPDGRVVAVASAEDPVMARALDLQSQQWEVLDPAVYDGGSSVMYRPGKILKTGSARNPNYPTSPASTSAVVLDMTEAAPRWHAVSPMAVGRTQHNLTVLPTGDVLAIGGAPTSNPYAVETAVKAVEIWSPATEQWTTAASMSEPRLYHSIALLLPDARVLVAGGGRFGPDYPSAEVYSPPYLFQGARPAIASAPAELAYGRPIAIGTPDAARVAKVTLLALGSVTHAFNESQRYVELPFVPSAGGIQATAPAGRSVAPPGYYMLFIVDNTGVPSVARIVRLPAPWEDVAAPSAPWDLTASSAPGRVLLTWSPASDDTGVVRYNVHRGASAGFTPSAANRIGTSSATSFTDTGFALGTYAYRVTAEDAAGHVGPPSNAASITADADTTLPSVAITAPAPGSVVSGSVAVTAAASDDIGLTGVQFVLDGVPLGALDKTAPYTVDWNSHRANHGEHLLAARAQDARGNTVISAPVTVTVSNDTVEGLVAAYSFDEGAGAIARDVSGNGNRGTITGAAWTSSGHSGAALSFDGAGDSMQIPYSPSIDVSGKGLTLEAWVNINGSSSVDYVLLSKPWTDGSAGLPGYQYAIEYDANGTHTLDFYLSDTTGTKRGPYRMTPATSSWTHVAYTFDGTLVSGYLDGVLKLAAPLDADIQSRPSSLRIGVDGTGNQGFKGRIDDLRIYDRALSQTEIQADLSRPVPRAIPPVSGLTASRIAGGINLAWNVAGCGAPGYHVVFGALLSLPAYDVSGGVCGLGTSGSFSWGGVPAGSLWFVVVGDDPSGTEGSWGTRNPGGSMKGNVPSGVCGAVSRVSLSACP